MTSIYKDWIIQFRKDNAGLEPTSFEVWEASRLLSARREAELLERISQLEERAAQAAELVSKAVEMMVPPKERD